jgi:hypothetical protein
MDRNCQYAPDKTITSMSVVSTYAGPNPAQASLHELAHQLDAELGKALSRANVLDDRLRPTPPMPMPTKEAQAPQSLGGVLDVLEECVRLSRRLHVALDSLETRIGG